MRLVELLLAKRAEDKEGHVLHVPYTLVVRVARVSITYSSIILAVVVYHYCSPIVLVEMEKS